ncbi:ATP-binding protein [Aminiphilus sp.]|jgi:anti-sigma regulatory factor (Ser/Thr protein kinase)|uniref:ATP-binding protein n=1 Tax=Aminiphilus sp. TaxID=1872488 RepID=UPI002631D0E9|nr:ATP-binding protein [Aminiphilus sp.]
MERTWPATTDALKEVQQFVLENTEGLPPKRMMHLELAIEEIVVNICTYAYETPPGEFTVRVIDDAVALTVEFEDKGIPFNPLSLEEPDINCPLEERKEGGMGILFVRRIMDEVHYRRDNGVNRLGVVVRKK